MSEVKIKKTKGRKLAYIEHVGDYGSIPFDNYISQLYGWAKEKKIRPGFQPMGVFYDSPEKTPSEKCRSEIGIPITGEAKLEPEKRIKIKNMPPMTVAMIKHKGSAKEYPETYRKLSEWIVQNGYEWAGPAIEVYTRKPEVASNGMIIYATVQAPVKKIERAGEIVKPKYQLFLLINRARIYKPGSSLSYIKTDKSSNQSRLHKNYLCNRRP